MKIRLFSLILLLNCLLSTSLQCNRKVSRLSGSLRSSRLQLISPENALDTSTWGPAMDYASDVTKQAADSFLFGFQSRVIGTLFGNVLAGIAFKVVADWAWGLWRNNSLTVGNDKSTTPRFAPPTPSPPPASPTKEPPKIPKEAWVKLFFCLFIDAIGDSSFVLPGVGEVGDAAWAPLSALAVRSLFQSDIIAFIDFAKEILPFTDIIPLATAMWLLQYVFVDSPWRTILRLGAPLKR
eukprot:gene7090-7841_t